MGFRLRPPAKTGENFDADLERVTRFQQEGDWTDPEKQLDLLLDFSRRNPPEYLLRAIRDVINHPYTGLSSLALASLAETEACSDVITRLPDLEEASESDFSKRDLVRVWLDAWRAQRLSRMPNAWIGTEVIPESGPFPTRFRHLLGSSKAQKLFKEKWIPNLLDTFAEESDSRFLLKKGRTR